MSRNPREDGSAPQEPLRGVKTPELKITAVNVIEYCSGIPLQGFKSVASALDTFASGKTRTGRATQNNLLDALGNQADGLGVGLYLLATADVNPNRVVTEMLEEAKPALERKNGSWSRHFDYDAMGTAFFKTTVEISRLPDTEDGFLLGLNAAYVGKKVEDGLAETLGIEQGLQRKDVNIVLDPEGENADRFGIDFTPIAQRLQAVYSELNAGKKSGRLKGETILDGLLGGRSGDTKPFVLGVTDGISVSLRLGRLGDRFNWRGGNAKEELWKRKGTVLSGALAESYRDEGKLEPASIVIDIRRNSDSEYSTPPAVDPVMKAKMNEIASKVAAAFSQ
jgi:hypothetical protein